MKKLLISALALTAVASFAAVPSHRDGGKVPPIHRLSVKDAMGDSVVPCDPNALPVSTRQTCSMCHDYDSIASGWHFNAGSTNVCPGRGGEPWFAIDRTAGVQIPLSQRAWKGTFKPSEIGMSDFDFTWMFARNLPGGGIASPCEDELYAGRWNVSGGIDVNCFVCHDRSGSYDFSEYAKQIARQNFSWAMTAAMGWGEVDGVSERMPDYWGMLNGKNKDDSIFRVPASVSYDGRQFDSKHRLVMKVGKPTVEACLNCHGATAVGVEDAEIDGDVHVRAGMSCADCHRNGVDHNISRGFEKNGQSANEASLTCAGCHVAKDGKAGRFGAPAPEHVGFPLCHFEKLSCTVCHSGVTPGGELGEVTTSRANRMGVYGRAKWLTDAPFIQEPVFVKNEKTGKVEPHRIVWPAYWGSRKDGKVSVVKAEKVVDIAGKSLSVMADVGAVLKMLEGNPYIAARGLRAVLVVDGKSFRANVDGIPVPFGEAGVSDGYYYLIDKSRQPLEGAGASVESPVVVVGYDPNFNAQDEKQTAEQTARTAAIDQLITTIESSALYNAKFSGAVVSGGKVIYRPRGSKEFSYIPAPAGAPATDFGLWDDEAKKFISFVDASAFCKVAKLAGTTASLTEEMLAEVLAKLASAKIADPVYIGHGKVWSLKDGQLVAEESDLAAPVTWAIGHDVRPARMARGAKPVKCADCHTVDSKFFFGEISSKGPLLTDSKQVKTQGDFMGSDDVYHLAFGSMFLVRPLFKIFLWVVFAVLALVAVAFAATAIPALLGKGGVPEDGKFAKLTALIDRLAGVAMALSALYLALSGAIGFFSGAMTGWPLVGHQLAGALFAVALLLLIWFRGAKRLRTGRAFWWMLALVLAVVTVFTAVAPMMTIFGAEWQHTLLWAHRCSAFCFLAVAGWMVITGGRKE